LSSDTGPREVLPTQLQTDAIYRAQTLAGFNAHMNEAQQRLAAHNYTAANEAVQQAKIALDRNQRYLSATEYDNLRSAATRLSLQIDEARHGAEATEKQQIARAQSAEAVERRYKAELERYEEIQKLLKRALDLRKEQKYDPALELINQ